MSKQLKAREHMEQKQEARKKKNQIVILSIVLLIAAAVIIFMIISNSNKASQIANLNAKSESDTQALQEAIALNEETTAQLTTANNEKREAQQALSESQEKVAQLETQKAELTAERDALQVRLSAANTDNAALIEYVATTTDLVAYAATTTDLVTAQEAYIATTTDLLAEADTRLAGKDSEIRAARENQLSALKKYLELLNVQRVADESAANANPDDEAAKAQLSSTDAQIAAIEASIAELEAVLAK